MQCCITRQKAEMRGQNEMGGEARGTLRVHTPQKWVGRGSEGGVWPQGVRRWAGVSAQHNVRCFDTSNVLQQHSPPRPHLWLTMVCRPPLAGHGPPSRPVAHSSQQRVVALVHARQPRGLAQVAQHAVRAAKAGEHDCGGWSRAGGRQVGGWWSQHAEQGWWSQHAAQRWWSQHAAQRWRSQHAEQ